jgi:hypothetical protein
MGLWRVLFLAEVNSRPSRSQDLSSGLKVVALEAKSRRTLLAVSGRTGSRTNWLGAVPQPLAGAWLLGT